MQTPQKGETQLGGDTGDYPSLEDTECMPLLPHEGAALCSLTLSTLSRVSKVESVS